MQPSGQLKNHRQEIQVIAKRTWAIIALISFLMMALVIRLAYLQIYCHHNYSTLSDKNWLDFAPILPARGLIYDRNGVLLAKNIPVFSLDVIPEKITDMDKSLDRIQKIIPLSKIDLQQFKKQLRMKRPFNRVPLKLRLSETEMAKFSVDQFQFPAFVISSRLIRQYPLGARMAHVLGYVGRINANDLTQINNNYQGTAYIGKIGIEKYYESILHGQTGFAKVEKDATGKPLHQSTQNLPKPGNDLHLTIDIQLQIMAQKALGKHKGAVVALDPNTGEILALVSMPTYDPNLFVSGMSLKTFNTLQRASSQPLYNRALRGLYALGSTIKPFLALAGLQTQAILASDVLEDPGWYQVKHSQHIFHDLPTSGHGEVNLDKAITVSCDTYFYELADKLGIEIMDYFLSQFGFGQLTQLDIGEELPGILPSPAQKYKTYGTSWYPGDTINTGIGQGYLQSTPLQLAVAVSALATRGKVYTPYLVSRESQADKTILKHEPTLLRTITLDTDEYWHDVITAMQHVITAPNGTGFRFGHHPGYTVAAKTGTAQVYSGRYYAAQLNVPDRLRDNSLFIAFAPVKQPKIALAVVVANSKLAPKIARQILDFYLRPEAVS